MAKARREETVISERFANKIKKAREDAADMIGSRQPRICGFEQRRGNPKPFEILGLSRKLKLPLDYLLDDEIEDPDDPRIMLTLVPEPVRKALELVIRLGPELAMARMLKIEDPTQSDPSNPNPHQRASAVEPGKVTLWESPASQHPNAKDGPKGRKKGPGPGVGPGQSGR
jgi:transcriptional regulator with XRE-family HTH domain